jgi:hypothetical protein
VESSEAEAPKKELLEQGKEVGSDSERELEVEIPEHRQERSGQRPELNISQLEGYIDEETGLEFRKPATGRFSTCPKDKIQTKSQRNHIKHGGPAEERPAVLPIFSLPHSGDLECKEPL